MGKKIIQITPATQAAWAIFQQDDGDDLYCKIHFWALVEYEDKDRTVEGFAISDVTDSVEDVKNFACYTDKPPNPADSDGCAVCGAKPADYTNGVELLCSTHKRHAHR